MVGLDHGTADSPESIDAEQVARNTRIGLKLFFIYSAIYAGFVALNAFRPDLMERTPIGGINVAILYGFGLIVGALVLSLFYGWLCHAPEPVERARGERE
jgi:uncharacterized membrane protein (DUF485 family)